MKTESECERKTRKWKWYWVELFNKNKNPENEIKRIEKKKSGGKIDDWAREREIRALVVLTVNLNCIQLFSFWGQNHSRNTLMQCTIHWWKSQKKRGKNILHLNEMRSEHRKYTILTAHWIDWIWIYSTPNPTFL